MQDLVNGVPLMLLVMALVEYIKKLGVAGNALLVASLLIGTALGVSYHFFYKDLDPTATNVFAAVVYGLMVGLTASGVYDATNSKASSN
jgi:hypothetical protein